MALRHPTCFFYCSISRQLLARYIFACIRQLNPIFTIFSINLLHIMHVMQARADCYDRRDASRA